MIRMNWKKAFWRISNQCNGSMSGYVSEYSETNKLQNWIILMKRSPIPYLQQQRGYVPSISIQDASSGSDYLSGTYDLVRNISWRVNVCSCFAKNILRPKEYARTAARHYGQSAPDDPDLNREFFVQLWVADKMKQNHGGKRRWKIHKHAKHDKTRFGADISFQIPNGRLYSGTSASDEKSYHKMKPLLKQPPTSQSATGILKPATIEEAKVAPLLARSNLLITRDIEWANLVFGFEQENRYAIVDACYPQSPAGFIREDSNVLLRQLLRLRRPFVAYIFDGLGNELFRVRRPFWWITSSIYAEINGKEIGVVHRRWHLWKRIYDLYLGNKQFAVVENPGFWNWTFTLKDVNGKVLAEIDRDWRGFGFEILTDAGQYVIRFGASDSAVDHATGIQELEVTRPLSLSERAVAVALAVSLDNDYFSRHGGWGIPFIMVGE